MKKGSFPALLPDDQAVIVTIGTGIAPIRNLLLTRYNPQRSLLSSDSVGKVILFNGCRNKEKDYIFSEELENYSNNSELK